MQKKRLSWLGHLERMDIGNWVSKCRHLDIVGSSPSGKTKKAWAEVVREDLRGKHIDQGMTRNTHA